MLENILKVILDLPFFGGIFDVDCSSSRISESTSKQKQRTRERATVEYANVLGNHPFVLRLILDVAGVERVGRENVTSRLPGLFFSPCSICSKIPFSNQF